MKRGSAWVKDVNFHKAVIRELANVTGASADQIVEAVNRAKVAVGPDGVPKDYLSPKRFRAEAEAKVATQPN